MTARTKKWPAGGEPATFERLVGPVRDALEQAYTMVRKDRRRGIRWNGPPIGEAERAMCLEFDDALRASSLKESEIDQGRDALDTILGIALQLGIEQGRRIERKRRKQEDVHVVR